ncbi:hypothetical protein [Stutzerimonas azotifigens]|uniref:hypothetical protein n=1 Tax=Stutzerimonas azotifigens TaxID=291995 RepID=UPI0004260B7E|nr:hypothetical protein [Stutzerimonas azotifigens]
MPLRPDALFKTLLAGLLCLVLPSMARPEAPSFTVGVCSHRMHQSPDDGRENRLLAAAGVTSVRTDAHWAHVERRRGQLAIEPGWTDYLDDGARRGLETLLILGYGNNHHGQGDKPRTEHVREAYERYVDYVAGTLRGRVGHYEIWNEWDAEDPHDPALAEDYARLVRAAARRIRTEDPDALVLAGAVTSAGIEAGFAHRLIDLGVLQAVDGLSLHPYVHCRGAGRDTPEAWIDWLRSVARSLNQRAGRMVPLYLTEMAWPSHQGACGIDERQQAAFLARALLLARTLPSIRGLWWYDARNDGSDRHEREHNFGLLDHDLAPKPAYAALAAVAPVVAHHDYRGRIDAGDDRVHLLHFANGSELLAAWTAGPPRSVVIRAPGPIEGRVQWLDTASPERGLISGEQTWQCLSGECRATLELSGFPKLVTIAAEPVER